MTGRETRRRVMRFISQHHAERGYPPTVREVADALGMMPSPAHKQVAACEERGWLEADERVSRGLRVVRDGDRYGDLVLVRRAVAPGEGRAE